MSAGILPELREGVVADNARYPTVEVAREIEGVLIGLHSGIGAAVHLKILAQQTGRSQVISLGLVSGRVASQAAQGCVTPALWTYVP
jgi:hypothetical protein